MIPDRQAEVLLPSQCYLGEGPLWHEGRQSFFWVDIENKTLFEYNWSMKNTLSRKFDHKVTVAIPCNNNYELILGLDAGIGRFNINTGELVWLINVEKPMINHRCNDGRCDIYGRLWIGTLDMNLTQGAGALYCIDNSLSVQKKLGNITISNGIAWSLDNTRLYYIDTITNLIQSYVFEAKKGDVHFEQNVISIPKELGSPDGMAIDEEGMLWIAHYGGYGVYRWNPHNGKLLEKISVAAPNVTSCAFAGEALDQLVITTAREGLSEDDLTKYPHSGDIFYTQMNIKGVKQNSCVI